jgi:hypothetical protein
MVLSSISQFRMSFFLYLTLKVDEERTFQASKSVVPMEGRHSRAVAERTTKSA